MGNKKQNIDGEGIKVEVKLKKALGAQIKTNIKINMKSTMVVNAWDPSMRESGAGGSPV